MLNLEADQLIILLLIAAAAHAVWIGLSMRLSAMFLLVAAFILISPFTMAADAKAAIVELKYARIYLSFLIGAVGVFMCFHDLLRSRLALATLGYYLLLLMGVVYSEYRFEAALYKLIGFVTLLGGICLGLIITESHQLVRNLRLLLWPSAAVALIFLGEALTTPEKIGRFGAFGMNPNSTGMACAALLCIPLYLALYDRAKALKIICWGVCFSLMLVLFFTGSRTSFGASILAVLCLGAPLVRRPIAFIATGAFAVGVMWYLLGWLEVESASRMLDTENSRAYIWGRNLQRWQESPWLGIGTNIFSDRLVRPQWSNSHSIYVQTLVEIGIFGAVAFGLVLLYTAKRVVGVVVAHRGTERWFALSVLAVALSIGIFESAPLMGASVVTLWWGMGLGLIERIPQLEQPSSVTYDNEYLLRYAES